MSYRLLNQGVAQRLGGLHSAPLLLHSVDSAGIAALQQAADCNTAAALPDAAGAEAPVLAANMMHKLAPQFEAAGGAARNALHCAVNIPISKAAAFRLAIIEGGRAGCPWHARFCR